MAEIHLLVDVEDMRELGERAVELGAGNLMQATALATVTAANLVIAAGIDPESFLRAARRAVALAVRVRDADAAPPIDDD